MDRRKLHVRLQKQQRSRAIRLIIALAFVAGVGACSKTEVRVEIEDENSRLKYIELLDEHEFIYTVDEEGVIYVQASPETHAPVWEKYRKWENEKYESEGVIVLPHN